MTQQKITLLAIIILLVTFVLSGCVASASTSVYVDGEKYLTPTPASSRVSIEKAEKFTTNVDVYVGFYFTKRFSMVAYKVGHVGPIYGTVDQGRFEQEIKVQYDQIAKNHSNKELALFSCQTDCPTNDTGSWGRIGNFNEGVEEKILAGLNSLGGESSRLNMQRQKFLLVYHKGSRQVGIELKTTKADDGQSYFVNEMLVQFEDGYSISLNELLQKLGINPDTKLELMNGVGNYSDN